MENKTKIEAEDGKQEIFITRNFDLPLNLLFRAYVEPEIVEQWMGTRVLALESRRYGNYQFETTSPAGTVHRFSGTIHEFIPNERITRTFEMEETPFPVQLEFLSFEETGAGKSKLTMQIVYKSVADRDNMLKLPFAKGIDMAHNRIQEIVSRLNSN